MSAINLTVLDGKERFTITAETGQTVLESLRSHQLYIPAICSGRGVCGKCKIKISKGSAPVTPEEEKFFSPQELKDGYRLACLCYPSEDMEIILTGEWEFEILTAYDEFDRCVNNGLYIKPRTIQTDETSLSSFFEDLFPGKSIDSRMIKKMSGLINDNGDGLFEREQVYVLTNNSRVLDIFPENIVTPMGIAIDIGTTTLGFEAVDLLSGKKSAGFSMINRQREYGADVVSRILNAGQGKLDALTSSIQEDILTGITTMCDRFFIDPKHIYRVVIAGNTTMLHLLLNLPCSSLGRFPFTPTMTAMVEYPFFQLFNSPLLNCPVCLLPSVSAYVGADITSGMIFCGIPSGGKTSLLIDLGTNGEMALFSEDKIICTSTAAGPAFEGGNISCGTGSIPGAVSKACFSDGKLELETIGGKEPIGICGSGVMDIVAELLKANLIDETGLLEEDYFDDGFPVYEPGQIYFTQKDIRELQLAKSAVRAGIEVLLEAAGIFYEDVDRVYLAGGFGNKVNLNSAVAIGLIPEEFIGRVSAVGNSSLGGCIKILIDQNMERDIVKITGQAKEINLSNDKRFNDLYIEYMCF